jgi:hypothetical protein
MMKVRENLGQLMKLNMPMASKIRGMKACDQKTSLYCTMHICIVVKFII